MLTESVIVTGRGLAVEQVGTEPSPDPKRKRRPDYVAPPPSDIDLGRLIEQLGHTNPHWSDEANDWADAHPEVRPKDAAKRWRRHRIEAT